MSLGTDVARSTAERWYKACSGTPVVPPVSQIPEPSNSSTAKPPVNTGVFDVLGALNEAVNGIPAAQVAASGRSLPPRTRQRHALDEWIVPAETARACLSSIQRHSGGRFAGGPLLLPRSTTRHCPDRVGP